MCGPQITSGLPTIRELSNEKGVCRDRSKVFAQLWYRDEVKIPLDRASVEGVNACRRSAHYPVSIDPVRSRETAKFVFGLKSSCGSRRQGLARPQWNDIVIRCGCLLRVVLRWNA